MIGFMRRQMRFAALLALSSCVLLGPETAFAGTGAINLRNFIQLHIIEQAMIVFWAVAIGFVFWYALRMIVMSHSEQSYTDLMNSFIHVFVGFAVIALATTFATAFYGTISPGNLTVPILNVIGIIIRASEGIFVLMITIAGLRMLTTEGDEAEFHKWRKVLTNSAIGAMIMMIANLSPAIASLFAGGNPTALNDEIVGLVKFMLTIVGTVSVLALIVAGILLIVSFDESYRDRAKRIIYGTLITLALVIGLYSIINTFVPTLRG
jgi:hypothetical protein